MPSLHNVRINSESSLLPLWIRYAALLCLFQKGLVTLNKLCKWEALLTNYLDVYARFLAFLNFNNVIAVLKKAAEP